MGVVGELIKFMVWDGAVCVRTIRHGAHPRIREICGVQIWALILESISIFQLPMTRSGN
jgi:hypothetical protein